MASIPLPPDETCPGHSEPPLRRHRVESTVIDPLDTVMKLALAKAQHDAINFTVQHHAALGQPVTNPCVKTGAVYRQFLAALGDAPLLDADGTLAKDVLLVYHGTRSVENAKRIMCEGFDPNKRSGQEYGTGEYFAETPKTSFGYAGNTGAVMLCAVFVRPAVVSRIWMDAVRDTYTIVNTPKDRSAAYALPLVVLPCTTEMPGTHCGRCTHGAAFNQYVRFRNDGG
jgi:hypothetical protein